MQTSRGEAARPKEIDEGPNRFAEKIRPGERNHLRIMSEAFGLLEEGPLSLGEVLDVVRAELAYCKGMQEEASQRMKGLSEDPDSINAGIDFSALSDRRRTLNDTWREIDDPREFMTGRPLLHEYLQQLSVRVSYYREAGAGRAEKIKKNIGATIEALCPEPSR